MPDLGRWFGMDQLSEKFHMTSPYAYVMNNPAMLIDPDGRVTTDWLMGFWYGSGSGSTTWTNTGDGFGNVPKLVMDRVFNINPLKIK